jgi:hypothetical protein
LRYHLVRAYLAVADATAGLGLIQLIVWPRWPQAAAKGLDHLSLPGGSGLPGRKLKPAIHTANLAQSPVYEFPIPWKSLADSSGLSGAPKQPDALLRLRLVEPRSWRSFQLAQVTAGIRALDVKKRTLRIQGVDELALGQINGEPALQTCLTAGGKGAVIKKSFFALSLEQPVRSRRQELNRLLGLSPNRTYQCLLVTLLGVQGNKHAEAKLISTWEELRPILVGKLAMITNNRSHP